MIAVREKSTDRQGRPLAPGVRVRVLAEQGHSEASVVRVLDDYGVLTVQFENRFRYVAAIPIGSGEYVGNLDAMPPRPEFDHPNRSVVALQCDHQRESFAGFPPSLAPLEKRNCLVNYRSRTPSQVTGGLSVLMISLKDQCRILRPWTPQYQALCLDRFVW